MKRRVVSAGLFAFLALFLVVGQTSARPVFTKFTGTATTLWLESGEWTYLPDKVIVKNLTHEDLWAASDPRVDGGHSFITVYAKLDLEGNGRMWGTFKLEMDDGTWEGFFHGDVYTYWEDGFVAYAFGHGTGAYEGQMLRLVNDTGSLSGVIIDRMN